MEQSLGELLSQKERERQELVPEQKCLFCKTILRDERRHALMAHLWEVHHFKIGHPDNLVYIDAFIGCVSRAFLLLVEFLTRCEQRIAEAPGRLYLSLLRQAVSRL